MIRRFGVPDLPRRTRTRGPGGMRYLGGRYVEYQLMVHMVGALRAARKA
jgi:hypothetical protein